LPTGCDLASSSMAATALTCPGGSKPVGACTAWDGA
jgi:hypothetical protein